LSRMRGKRASPVLRGAGRSNAPGLPGVPALVAGMVAGADSIDDMDLLRHGGMGRLCVPRTLEPGLCRRG
jgi:hypothetical protein